MAESTQLLGTEEIPAVPPTSDEKTMALLAHLLTIIVGFLGPLIIWLVKKDESKFVGDSAKEALNFIITLAIGYIIGFFLIFVFIGILIIACLGIVQLILVIIATIKTSEGKMYRYPINLRLIK